MRSSPRPWAFTACPAAPVFFDISYQAVEHVLHVNCMGAQEYMESRRRFMSAGGKPAAKWALVSEKLNRVKIHMLEMLRKIAMLKYFNCLGIDVGVLTQAEAQEWQRDAKYVRPPMAGTAVVPARKALFRRTGQVSRVVDPGVVGHSQYANASMEYVALIAHWACTTLQKAVGVCKARRAGNDDCSYAGLRDHIIMVKAFRPRHTRPDSG